MEQFDTSALIGFMEANGLHSCLQTGFLNLQLRICLINPEVIQALETYLGLRRTGRSYHLLRNYSKRFYPLSSHLYRC